MSSLVSKFNSRLPRPARVVLVVAAGVLLGRVGFAIVEMGPALRVKLRGDGADCPWRRVLSINRDSLRLFDLRRAAEAKVSIKDYEESLDIELVTGLGRHFWIKRGGEIMQGDDLLACLVSVHEWVEENSGPHHVAEGDVVLDCGAHVGVFTHKALQRGASKVVAIEPDPANVVCLRRNFHQEIRLGRVLVVSKGVWSQEKQITLFLGVENSGMNTVMVERAGGSIEVPVTTIDNLVRSLGLMRVDFIKMDIEGAEREALRGASETLRRFRPRLMIDSYHFPGDMQVLPEIIREVHPDYQMSCGPCELAGGKLIPHVTFFR